MDGTPRKSGIPKPIRSGMESSFSTSNGNLLRMSLSPSPTEEFSKSRWALNSSSSSSQRSTGTPVESPHQRPLSNHSTPDQKMMEENAVLKFELATLKKQIMDLHRRFEKEQSTRDTFETIQFEQKKAIKTLQNNFDRQTMEYKTMAEKNAKFRQKLYEALPVDDSLLKEASLIISGGAAGGPMSHCDSRIFSADDEEGVIGQVEKLKNYTNKLELQIYEMNEKFSELIENTQQLERENKKLKVETENMNSLAKIVTANMKESIETNKRLENEIRALKSENEHLIRERQPIQNNNNHSPTRNVSFENTNQVHLIQQQQQHHFQQINNNNNRTSNNTMSNALPNNAINTNHLHHNNNNIIMVNHHQQQYHQNQVLPPTLPSSGPPPLPKKPEHLPPTKRITEMHERELIQVVEDELTRTVELLNCKLGLLADELQVAVNRAEVAELELNELRRASRLALNPKGVDLFDVAISKLKSSPIPTPPPPPPPPIPPAELYLPKIKLRMPSSKLKSSAGGGSGDDFDAEDESGLGGSSKATGMDALISELKHGQVTLRKRRKQPQETTNPALRELFEVLEKSQLQNRSSKTFLINNKYNLRPDETTNEQF